MDAHREIHFEDFIVDYLADHGWQVGEAANYDRVCVLHPEDLVGYLRETQPEAWEKLERFNGAATDAIIEAMTSHGSMTNRLLSDPQEKPGTRRNLGRTPNIRYQVSSRRIASRSPSHGILPRAARICS